MIAGNAHALDFISHSSTLSPQVVLLSQSAAANSFGSGIQNVLYGAYPANSLNMSLAWNPLCWKNANLTAVTVGQSYSVSYRLVPNNHDFPVYLLDDLEQSQTSLPDLDLQTYLTGNITEPLILVLLTSSDCISRVSHRHI